MFSVKKVRTNLLITSIMVSGGKREEARPRKTQEKYGSLFGGRQYLTKSGFLGGERHATIGPQTETSSEELWKPKALVLYVVWVKKTATMPQFCALRPGP